MHPISHGLNPGPMTLGERLAHIEMWAWGVRGANGANGRIHALEAGHKTLADRQDGTDRLFLKIATIWKTVQWIAAAVGLVLGPLALGKVGEVSISLLKLIGG